MESRFYKAVEDNDIYEIKFLLSNASFETKVKNNALFRACSRNHIEIVKLLLEYGADVNSRDIYNNCPLQLAARDFDLWKLLLENDANVNSHSGEYEKTPLHTACESDDCLKLVKLVVEHGAIIDSLDTRGYTPLHYACRYSYNSIEIIRFLLEKGAYMYAESKYGETIFNFIDLKNKIELRDLIYNHKMIKMDKEINIKIETTSEVNKISNTREVVDTQEISVINFRLNKLEEKIEQILILLKNK